MQRLTIDLGPRSYPIYIGSGLLAAREVLERHLPQTTCLIVTNTTVGALYLARLRQALTGRVLVECLIEDGEQFKTLDTASRIIDALAGGHVHRDGAVLALGGGVIGDMAGFAAACYQRGIGYLQLPTTLLAQVDSAVGGKTGVNHPTGKNLIGAFHQPLAVLSDLDTLATLPDRELKAGLAEVIKYGLIEDADFFAWLEGAMPRLVARDPEALATAIRRSCQIKAAIVSADERESGRRALLNFGHTFGHAIEAATGYGSWLHGEAVAVGMLKAAALSARLGWLDGVALTRIRALIAAAGLPSAAPAIGIPEWLRLMRMDKKVAGNRLRLILLRGIGAAVISADYGDVALQATLADSA
jgi:3-dehydroquinate synthase